MKSQADLKSQSDTITHWGWGFYRLSESWWGIWLCLLWYEHQKHQNWRDLDEKIILDIQFFIKLQKSRKLEQKPGFTFFLELCPESLISSAELKDFSEVGGYIEEKYKINKKFNISIQKCSKTYGNSLFCSEKWKNSLRRANHRTFQ